MKGAVCTICTEPLEHLREVSALRCGHLFHADCLAPWLSQSMTCPQCRQKVTRANIIHKLFFSRPDADDSIIGEPNTALELSRISSKLEEMQNKLCLREREVAKLSAEKSAIDDKASQLTESYRSLESLHRKELDNNRLLRQQLSLAQSAVRQLNDVQKETAVLKRKVTELQNVQSVINGCQDDIDSLIRETSDATQLATWCTVYKAELARKRSECHGLTELLRKAKRDVELAQRKLADQTTELTIASGRIAGLEEDIASQNKEMSSLHKKLEALEAALESPSNTAAGFARRLIKESPAPSLLFKTPKLSTPSDRARVIDLDTSADLFTTPKPIEPSKKRPRLEEKQKTSDQAISSVTGKFTLSTALRTVSSEPVNKHTASVSHRNVSHNPAGKLSAKVSASLRNISNKPSAANAGTALGSKIPFAVSAKFSQSSTFRVGYNGLGGHEKVVVPRPKVGHSVVHKKPVVGGQLKRFFGPSKTSSTPPLPVLDDSDVEN